MRKFLAVLAFLACGQAWADGGSIPSGGIEQMEVQRLNVAGLGRIDYLRLFEAVSEPGDTTSITTVGPVATWSAGALGPQSTMTSG